MLTGTNTTDIPDSERVTSLLDETAPSELSTAALPEARASPKPPDESLPLNEPTEQSSENENLSVKDTTAERIRAKGRLIKAKQNTDYEPPDEKKLPYYYKESFYLRYMYRDENGKPNSIALCYSFNVLELIVDPITNAHDVLIEFWPHGRFHERPITTRIPSADLEQTKLRANHLSKGEPFFRRDTITHVISYIREEARRLDAIYEIPVVGWIRRDGKPNGERVFVCKDYAITKNGVDRSLRYSGEKLSLSMKGSADEAIAGLNPFLNDNAALQAAASSGLAAPLIEPLDINEIDSLVLHLKEDSTVGKSTAGSLAIAMFAYSKTTPTGLKQKFFQTLNSITSVLAGNHGYPFCADESGMAEYTTESSFAYKLASGMDKGRKGDKPDMSGYGITRWRSLIISNGEHSILSDKLATGARIRILELNEQWTKSAAEAESIMAFLEEQHGTIGLRFVSELLKLGDEGLKAEYNRMLDEIKPLTPPDRLSQRLAGTLAIIVTAASLANKLIGLEIDYVKVMHFLLRATTLESVQTPMYEQAAEYIKNKLMGFDGDVFIPRTFRKNRSGKLETPIMKRGGTIGKVVWRKTDTPVSVILTKKNYEEIVSEQFDIAIVTRALKDGGYIKCGSNGTTKNGIEKTVAYKKCWINGSVQMVIEFNAEKMGVLGDDAVELVRVTQTHDCDGVSNGTRHETYRIEPEIIYPDGTSSKLPPSDPRCIPPDEFDFQFGEPVEIRQFNETGEPVEDVDDSKCMIISDGHVKHLKETPF